MFKRKLYHKDTLFKNNKLTPHTHPNWKGGFAKERVLIGAKNKNTQLGVEVKRETSNNRRFIYTFFLVINVCLLLLSFNLYKRVT